MRPAFLLLISAIIIIIRADARFDNVATPSHFPRLVFPVVVRNPSGKKMKPWSDVSDEPPPTEAKPQTTTTKAASAAAAARIPVFIVIKSAGALRGAKSRDADNKALYTSIGPVNKSTSDAGSTSTGTSSTDSTTLGKPIILGTLPTTTVKDVKPTSPGNSSTPTTLAVNGNLTSTTLTGSPNETTLPVTGTISTGATIVATSTTNETTTTTTAPSTTPETTSTTTAATTTTGKASTCATQPTCPNAGASANSGCASTRFPLPLQCCSVPVNPHLYVARYTRTAFVLAVAQNLDTQLSHKFEHYLAEALAICTPSEDEIVKSIRVVLGLVQGDLLSGSIDFIEEFVVMAKLKQRSSHGKNAAARSIATHKGMVEITSALMAALKGNVRTSNILNTLLHVSHEFVDVSAEGAGSVVLAALLAMRRTHTGETGDCITQRFGHAAPIAQLLMVFFAASDLQEGPFSDSFQAVYDGSIAKWSRMERTAVRADLLDTYGDVIENKSPKLRTDVNTIKRTNDAGFWSRRVLHRRRNSRPLASSTDPPERSIADVELFDVKT